jgi:hypothetical protein
MAPQEIAALTAQVNGLDRETARRVARLVLECNASLKLALSAVQDVDRSAQKFAQGLSAGSATRVVALPATPTAL